MKLIYVCLISLLALPGTTASFAKSNTDEMKAKYLYTHMAFHEAIPYYEKVLAAGASREMYEQLGDCYRATGDYERAANSYKLAMGMDESNDMVILHYAQALMTLTQYGEAEKLLARLQQKNSNDRRIANLLSGCRAGSDRLNKTPAGNVTLEDFNTDGSEFAPTMWKNKLVFTSDAGIGISKKNDKWTGKAYYNMYSVSCDKEGHCASDISKISADKNINIKYHDGPCTFSADGSTMYFTRTRYEKSFLSKKAATNKNGVAILEVMIASGYDDAGKKFETIKPFQYNSKDYSVANPAISPDGNMLVFSSDMPGGAGGSDLYMCKKMSDGTWSHPESLGNTINTEGEELFPYFGDDNTLYFSSDGHPGFGGLDIYRATWDNGKHTFSVPENAGMPVNSSYDDISLAMDPAGKTAYFSSNRPASKKGDNIYFYKKEDVVIPEVKKDTMPAPTPVKEVAKAKAEEAKPETTVAEEPVTKTVQQPVAVAATKKPDHKREPKPEPKPKPKPKPEPKPVEKKNDPVFKTGETYSLPDFHYAFKQADIVKGAEKQLDTLYHILITHPGMRIQVNAFTDCRGNETFNLKLSYARALSVVKFLERKGISSKRLTYKGYGVTKPVVKCPVCKECTEEQHQLNRGIEFKVLAL